MRFSIQKTNFFSTSSLVSEELFLYSIYFNGKQVSIEITKFGELNISLIIVQIRPKWRFRNWTARNQDFLKKIEVLENRALIRINKNQIFVDLFLAIFILYSIDNSFGWIFFKKFQNSFFSFSLMPLTVSFFFNEREFFIKRTLNWKINISSLGCQLKPKWRFINWIAGHKDLINSSKVLDSKIITKINKEFYVDIFLAFFIVYHIDSFFCWKLLKFLTYKTPSNF